MSNDAWQQNLSSSFARFSKKAKNALKMKKMQKKTAESRQLTIGKGRLEQLKWASNFPRISD